MLQVIGKISMEQRFMIMAFVLSVLLSFLLGYTVFRYVQVDLCKSPIKIGPRQEIYGNWN